MDEQPTHEPWQQEWPLDDRDRKHIAFCQDYAERWRHGAPGHIDFMLIAKLAWLLNSAQTHTYPVEPWQG